MFCCSTESNKLRVQDTVCRVCQEVAQQQGWQMLLLRANSRQLIYRLSDLSYQCLILRHKYEFLHNRTTPDLRITVPPKTVGILLDYENSRLSFFNADIAQHLYSFSCELRQFVHPCFSLEKPGCLKIRNGIPIPRHVTFY